MRTIDGEEFLSPQEAAQKLAISSKTLQRWADIGGRWAWYRAASNSNGNGNSNGHSRMKEWREVKLDVKFTRAGHRLYRRVSIESLLDELRLEEKEHRDSIAA
jgi:predicted site-specific integrase-resolvase